MNEALLALKAEKLPVFTVGVGSEALPRDIQIDRVMKINDLKTITDEKGQSIWRAHLDLTRYR